MYAFSENFMLALSHDEVVHGKGSLINKMPGDHWQKFANLRSLFGYMFTHPGKKTLFMGMEFGQWREWNVWNDLDWWLLESEPHHRLKQYISDLNALYRSEPALYSEDFSFDGFEWISCDDAHQSVVSFMRKAKHSDEFLVIVCNFPPIPRHNYWVGVPQPGFYAEIFNSDAEKYGGSNLGNFGGKQSFEWGNNRFSQAIELSLPPLGVIVLKLDERKTLTLEAETK
jgi:1,4-alpha-glucan branching enzyme